jgi:hypothetical protein
MPRIFILFSKIEFGVKTSEKLNVWLDIMVEYKYLVIMIDHYHYS